MNLPEWDIDHLVDLNPVPLQYRGLIKLWVAVLDRAIVDFVVESIRYNGAYKFNGPASWWFLNDTDRGPRSFRWICDHLNVAPERIRAAVIGNYVQMYEQDQRCYMRRRELMKEEQQEVTA